MLTTTSDNKQCSVYSTVIPGSVSVLGRTAIRRSANPSASPELAYKGCYSLYECVRRGKDIAPMGPCLGYRAVSTSGAATPYVYCNYTEIVARIDAIAAGLQRLHLLTERNDSGMLLVSYISDSFIFFFPLPLSSSHLCLISSIFLPWSSHVLCYFNFISLLGMISVPLLISFIYFFGPLLSWEFI